LQNEEPLYSSADGMRRDAAAAVGRIRRSLPFNPYAVRALAGASTTVRR